MQSIKSIKKDLEHYRIEAEQAEIRADLSKAAEIRYGKIPAAQKELEIKAKKLKKLQSTRRILKEEVGENEVAGVVSRWTGVPTMRMLEGEATKLVRMEEELKKDMKYMQFNDLDRVHLVINRSLT